MSLAYPDTYLPQCETHQVSRLPRVKNPGSLDLRYGYYCHFCEHPEQVGVEASAAVETGPAGHTKTARRSRQRAGRVVAT